MVRFKRIYIVSHILTYLILESLCWCIPLITDFDDG